MYFYLVIGHLMIAKLSQSVILFYFYFLAIRMAMLIQSHFYSSLLTFF